MRIKPIITVIALVVIVGGALLSAPEPQPDTESEALKRRYNELFAVARCGMEAGYMACQYNIPLSNCISTLEKKFNELVDAEVAAELKRRTIK